MRLVVILIFPLVVFSQNKITASLEFNNEPLSKILLIVEKEYDVRFSYQNRFIDGINITLKKNTFTLDNLMNAISLQTNLAFKRINSRYIVITKLKDYVNSLKILDEILIYSYLTKGILKDKTGKFQIKSKNMNILPGLTEPDVLESIQQLPGVISPNETASNFTVRGGTSDQNRVIWDGINMYHKGHLFGMISAFNPNAIKEVNFINKGTHARFGERISSIIDISSNKTINKKLKATLGFNAINTDALIELPIIKNKLSVIASLRSSYTQFYQSYTFDKLVNKVYQNTKIANEEHPNKGFHFLDYTVKLNYQFNKTNKFYLSIIDIDNELNYFSKNLETNEMYNDKLAINNKGYSFEWNKIWSSKVHQVTQGFVSDYKLNYNYIINEEGAQVSDFYKNNAILDSGLSTEININFENSILSLGYQYAVKDVSYIFTTDSDDLSIILDSNKNIVYTYSFYNNYNYKNSNGFNLNLGLRTSYFENLNTFKLEPRLLIHQPISKNLSFQISGEIKNQIISEIDETILSDLSLENKLWRLADNDKFPIINSNQSSLGIIYKYKGWMIDLDYYYKNIYNITSLSLGFLNPTDNSFRIGNQKVIGIDFFVKKSFKKLNTWFSYSYGNVKNKYEGINNYKYFTANTNIEHSFTSSITYKIKKIDMALGWKWQSGRPYTHSIEGQNGLEFNEGINTRRLDNYHRLDFSSTYSFDILKKEKLKGKIGFSIRNLYNRKNHISKGYRGNNSLEDPITAIDEFSVGFMPNIVFRAYW